MCALAFGVVAVRARRGRRRTRRSGDAPSDRTGDGCRRAALARRRSLEELFGERRGQPLPADRPFRLAARGPDRPRRGVVDPAPSSQRVGRVRRPAPRRRQQFVHVGLDDIDSAVARACSCSGLDGQRVRRVRGSGSPAAAGDAHRRCRRPRAALLSTARIFGTPWFYLTLWMWGITALMLVAVVATAVTALRTWGHRRGGRPTGRSLAAGRRRSCSSPRRSPSRSMPPTPSTPSSTCPTSSDHSCEPTYEAIVDGVGPATGSRRSLPRPLERFPLLRQPGLRAGQRARPARRATSAPTTTSTSRSPSIGCSPVRRTIRRLPTGPPGRDVQVHFATGAYVDDWRQVPGAVEVATVDLRTDEERADYAGLRQQLLDELESKGLDELVPMVDRNVFGLAERSELSREHSSPPVACSSSGPTRRCSSPRSARRPMMSVMRRSAFSSADDGGARRRRIEPRCGLAVAVIVTVVAACDGDGPRRGGDDRTVARRHRAARPAHARALDERIQRAPRCDDAGRPRPTPGLVDLEPAPAGGFYAVYRDGVIRLISADGTEGTRGAPSATTSSTTDIEQGCWLVAVAPDGHARLHQLHRRRRAMGVERRQRDRRVSAAARRLVRRDVGARRCSSFHSRRTSTTRTNWCSVPTGTSTSASGTGASPTTPIATGSQIDGTARQDPPHRPIGVARAWAAFDGCCDEDTWKALVEATWKLGDRLLTLTSPNLRGDDVAELQATLGRLGFDCGRVDGILGPRTARALVDFQSNCGLLADGVCGTDTVRALHRVSSQSGTGPGVASVREHDLLRHRSPSLATRNLVIGHFGGLGVIARAVGRELRRRGARRPRARRARPDRPGRRREPLRRRRVPRPRRRRRRSAPSSTTTAFPRSSRSAVTHSPRT